MNITQVTAAFEQLDDACRRANEACSEWAAAIDALPDRVKALACDDTEGQDE